MRHQVPALVIELGQGMNRIERIVGTATKTELKSEIHGAARREGEGHGASRLGAPAVGNAHAECALQGLVGSAA